MKYHLLIVALLLISTQGSIYDQYYADAKKIAEAMTLEEKIGQTIQADIQGITEK